MYFITCNVNMELNFYCKSYFAKLAIILEKMNLPFKLVFIPYFEYTYLF